MNQACDLMTLPEDHGRRRTWTSAELMRKLHGIEAGWACPSCERVLDVEAGATDHCRACGWFLPIPCQRCDGYAEAVDRYPPFPVCASCRAAERRDALRRRADKLLPADVVAHVTDDAYRPVRHRRDLDALLLRWLGDDCGRAAGRPLVYVWSPLNGTGKTRAVGRAAWLAITEARVADALWVREAEILRAHVERYADATDVAQAARHLLKRAEGVELLVLDELFARDGKFYTTEPARSCMADLLCARIEAQRPTLITSNVPAEGRGGCAFRTVLGDGRIGSRLAERGVVVEIAGHDLRRRAAALTPPTPGDPA